MHKMNGLETNLSFHDSLEQMEFYACVEDLLDIDEVRELHRFQQHCNTSRLQHSLNVAYYSFKACKRLSLDYRSAARAGILHDLFLYDWRTEKQPEGAHAVAHPLVALRNARRITSLNAMEEDCIVNHMWPVTTELPKYKETVILSLADKYSTCWEVTGHFRLLLSGKMNFPKFLFFGGSFAR